MNIWIAQLDTYKYEIELLSSFKFLNVHVNL